MRARHILLTSLIILSCFNANAQRKDIIINDDWKFRLSLDVRRGSEYRVDLPHTWNTQDTYSGVTGYHRGIGNYKRIIHIPSEWEDERIYLRFEGANCTTDLFINGRHAGQHKGGYGAFTFEITDFVEHGSDNTILARVNNAEDIEVMPVVGDFNFYGGIYRDVHLIVTGQASISLLDYGSSGVRLVQDSVSHQYASVRAITVLTNGKDIDMDATLRIRVLDGDKTVLTEEEDITLPADSDIKCEVPFHIYNPHLWDGRRDPFLYTAEITLMADGKSLDQVTQPLGLRYFHFDADKGFSLNGRHLPLHGVCRHQDRAETGNALRTEHHDEDAKILAELGANAVRLAHYPQSEYFYNLMDRYGIIVWAEIPFVGPGGYNDKGFTDTQAFKENGKEQLIEMIRQHYNHPSICVWGLFNELTPDGDNPIPYIKELNALAHAEDPTRPTTAATNTDASLNFITDLMGWNHYFGWYNGTPEYIGTWLDNTHKEHPDLKISISEYGAGASIYQQQDTLARPIPESLWHPENWQTEYHIKNWREISSRQFVWGSFVWNLFDFGASHRHEGDRAGINDKGLVTFDRKVKKDAYFFYKANWNKDEKMVYIAGRRNKLRTKELQTFTAFTNLPEAELFVNGKSYGKKTTDEICTVKWEGVKLTQGKNTIKVVARHSKVKVSDTYDCTLQSDYQDIKPQTTTK